MSGRLSAVLLLAACNGPMAAIDPEFTGCGSDEQWRAFDDYEHGTIADASQAPQLTAPDTSGVLAFAAKPVLAWNQAPNIPGKPDGDVPYVDGPGCMACCPQFTTGALTTLHLPVISGDEYDLQFADGATLVYRVITTLQEWTPPDDVWKAWKGRTLALKITRMGVVTNELRSGPFVAPQPTTLRIGL